MKRIKTKRLPPETFDINRDKIINGYFTDEYFNNVRRILEIIAHGNYRYKGKNPGARNLRIDLSNLDIGNIKADMQIFTRRSPFSIVCGTDYALALLKTCTGHFDTRGKFINTYNKLSVRSLFDGMKIEPWKPVMRLRGRYRDFAVMETVILGVLTRATKIATNTYLILKAAQGKPVFFFPARFDIYQAQELDGYAYEIGVDAYNRYEGGKTEPMVSTPAQAKWWGGKAGGTVSHSYLICFLRDTPEAMLVFSDTLPLKVKRIALVDVNNDCIGDSLTAAKAMFKRYVTLLDHGQPREAQKFVLFGVRPDTARNIKDISIEPLGNPELDCGVCARLVYQLREALDEAPEQLRLAPERRELARQYFRNIKIVVTGGFNPQRIARFEELGVPADMYGVGSYMFWGENNDYTADLVEVNIQGKWYNMGKVGRRPLDNPDLTYVRNY